MSQAIEIYTDGACKGNPGPGGWGVLLRLGPHEKRLYGGEPETTNNRMELTAAIRGLEALKRPASVVLTTDSQYVMKGVREWMPNWKKRNWQTASKHSANRLRLHVDPSTTGRTGTLSCHFNRPGVENKGGLGKALRTKNNRGLENCYKRTPELQNEPQVPSRVRAAGA